MMITLMLLIFLRISDVCMGSSTRLKHDVKSKEKFNWTPELDAIVKNIYHETRGVNHQVRMKEEWDRIFPQFKNIGALSLRRRALNLLFKGDDSGRDRINWTPELNSDLLRMFHETLHSSGRGPTFELHNKFYNKYPEIHRIGPASLWIHAKKVHRRCLPNETANIRKNILWKDEHADELIQIYRQHLPNYKDQAQKLHEEWVKLHPEHKNKKPHFLQSRMREIARQKAKEGENYGNRNHRWSRQNYADLLHIYRRVQPRKVGYLSTIAEFWSKMHPELNHMTRDNLRSHIKLLKEQRYEPTESEDERARKRFDKLPLLEDIGDRERGSHKLDKRKRKVYTSNEELESMYTQQQVLHPYNFYDFMSVNESHGRSSDNSDKNVHDLHIASDGRTLHDYGNEIPYARNYYHGESSNLSSQQQSNPVLSSPSRNSPEQFFNFF